MKVEPRMIATIAMVLVAIPMIVTSCGGEEPMNSTQISEQKLLSKNNAHHNARIWKSEVHPQSEVSLIPESDSAITKDCPFGDGFATVSYVIEDILGDDGKGKLQCQTYGSDVGIGGCLTNEEFALKPRYVEIKNNGCDPDIDTMVKL